MPEDYYNVERPTLTVFESQDGQDTGLLDQRGNPIVSFERVGPIGFNR